MYAEKFKIDVVRLMNRLWGESFFNPKTKKWSKQKEPDNKRSFCMYVLDPIYKVIFVTLISCIASSMRHVIFVLLLYLYVVNVVVGIWLYYEFQKRRSKYTFTETRYFFKTRR